MPCYKRRLPHWDPENAALLRRLYNLRTWVIMSNSAHLLIEPKAARPSITNRVKSFSARDASRILNRTGQPFWALESYHRWVRSPRESESIVRYIGLNPVKAGIVVRPEDYRWSSASAGQEARVT